MANVVEIIVQGHDRSGPATASATRNFKQLGKEMRSFGTVASQVGSVASSLGSTHISGLAGKVGGLIFAGEALALTFRKVNLTLKGTAIGLAVAAAAIGVAKWMEYRESVADAAVATEKLSENTQSANREMKAMFSTRDQAILSIEDGHRRRMEQIEELEKAGADAAVVDQALKMETHRLEREMFMFRAKEYQIAADLEEKRREESIQGFFQMIQTQQDLFNNSMLNMRDAAARFSANISLSISDGIGDAVANIATGAKSASEAFRDLGKSLLGMLVKWAAQMIINSILAIALQGTISAAAAAFGVAVATSWSTAAALVSLATFGANAAPANAALIGTTAVARGLAVGGQFHGGIDSVPAEGSYLLSRGERVIQPQANEQLVDFLEGQGSSQPTQVNIYLDGVILGRGIGQMSRDGRLEISARAII